MRWILALLLTATPASAQSITGTITTKATGTAPVRVTFDQKICGNGIA